MRKKTRGGRKGGGVREREKTERYKEREACRREQKEELDKGKERE